MQSITKFCIPEDWKKANLIPIFKKGSRGDLGNDRPLGLMLTLDKLMGSIIKAKFSRHTDEQKLLGRISIDSVREDLVSLTC